MSASPDAAIITNSGSTNVRGYTIVVQPDGTANLTRGSAVSELTIEPAAARRLFEALRAAPPLDALNVRRCAKSASFGTVTTVAWRGRRSPDLSCGGDAEVGAVWSAVSPIVREALPATGRAATKFSF